MGASWVISLTQGTSMYKNQKHLCVIPLVFPQMSNSETTSDCCSVCGGAPNGGHRYGPMACLSCITFFRRAISSGNVGDCKKQSACEINHESKNSCRSCRLQKCLNVGMNPKAIQHRDPIGQRSPPKDDSDSQKSDLQFLLDLQKKQRIRNQKYGIQLKNDRSVKKQYRPANADDIRLTMSLGFQNAISWANPFEAFKNLTDSEKAAVMSEFGVAFVLIEQAFKSAKEADEGVWLLQNNTFLGLKEGESVQAKINSEFVKTLLKTLCEPIRTLQLDKFDVFPKQRETRKCRT
ncbi:Nuclear receptor domain-containing protein [Caenorhabditis elegans]|uniref:Nuclear receptor domain-containing protein n=1 Tax=Caenorhabditis elegans TaxID=6239 RepID=A7LPI6_CAEEL|nr:Nuclear receptor domain-containing protein [Caenorhabditis elegans]CAO82053.2 Nuclear receptor domain-containing protein [Caenorhabditis elegans]|eukprot:NP_001123077.1 Uncharacterized protein CELE_ZK1037.13 [Caenorhabditis elegans]